MRAISRGVSDLRGRRRTREAGHSGTSIRGPDALRLGSKRSYAGLEVFSSCARLLPQELVPMLLMSKAERQRVLDALPDSSGG